MVIRVIRAICVLLNIEILIFFRLNIYKGACMSTTIHQTMSYLYLPDSNNLFSCEVLANTIELFPTSMYHKYHEKFRTMRNVMIDW